MCWCGFTVSGPPRKTDQEANNDAGLAAHPSQRWAMNCVHFQLAMLAYNLNCWLLLFTGTDSGRSRDETYPTVHDATAFSVSGGQNLGAMPAEWASATAIITRERNLSAADGSLAAHPPMRQRIRTRRTHSSSLLTKHRAWFFMHSKRRSSNNLQHRENADRDYPAETQKDRGSQNSLRSH